MSASKRKRISEFLNRISGEGVPADKNSALLRRRIAHRRKTDAAGLYKVLDRDRYYARHYTGIKNSMSLIDISTTGLAFRTNVSIPVKAYMEVEISMLSAAHTFGSPAIIGCETVYCMGLESPWKRIGTRFLDIKPEDAERIRNFTEPNRAHNGF